MLVTQPAQSTDFSVNHLEFLASLNSGVWKEMCESADEMLTSVLAVFAAYGGETCARGVAGLFQ